MNKTKKGLIIAVIVLNFLNAALDIYFIVQAFMKGLNTQSAIANLVFDFLEVVGLLVSAGLLIYCISNDGRFFSERNPYYMSAVIISIFSSMFTISSILLLITLFISDIVWVKPIDDVYFGTEEKPEPEKMKEEEKERKIKQLRDLRDKGLITEEEFRQSLLKLL